MAELRQDENGLYIVIPRTEPVRPRCWLDWENTSDYEPEEDDGPVRPRCWLEGEK